MMATLSLALGGGGPPARILRTIAFKLNKRARQ